MAVATNHPRWITIHHRDKESGWSIGKPFDGQLHGSLRDDRGFCLKPSILG